LEGSGQDLFVDFISEFAFRDWRISRKI